MSTNRSEVSSPARKSFLSALWNVLKLKQARARQLRLIGELFDREWYLSQNPDVASAGVDPIGHYLHHGSKEGRRPNSVFDPKWYSTFYKDLEQWPLDPFCHFILHGRIEGRLPSPEFNPGVYLRIHPDVAKDHWDATEHYVKHGRQEGRVTRPTEPPQVRAPHSISEPAATVAPQPAFVPQSMAGQAPAVIPHSGIIANPFGSMLQISAQNWRLQEVVGQTTLASVLGTNLLRALTEARLDATHFVDPSNSIDLFVAASSGFSPPCDVDILVATLLEEDGSLIDLVTTANHHTCGVICASTYGRDALINNGLLVASAAIGIGVDQWDHIVASARHETSGKRFRFLHIASQCADADVEEILRCFGHVFDSVDDVSLIILTPSDNCRQKIIDHVAAQRVDDPLFPDVIIQNAPLSDSDIKGLYQSCHIYLASNQLYSFNLPVAQAMMCGMPSIVIGYGGHMDYCDDDNAWLVDFDFKREDRSGSVSRAFAPRVILSSLEASIWEAYSCGPARRLMKAWAGRKKLLSAFTWKDVALRLAAFAERKNPTHLPVGWVTTWNVRCGIGIYVEHLLSSRSTYDHIIFAARQEPRTRSDATNVIRAWDVDKVTNGLNDILKALTSQRCSTVIIQFNYGFYNHFELSKFIDDVIERGMNVFVDLHSTVDHGVPNYQLSDFTPALMKSHRILVHNASDWARLKRLGLWKNVLFSPLGVLALPARESSTDPKRTPIVVSFGFCFEGKGLVELVNAIALLRERGRTVHLRMLNAEYPAPHSRGTVINIREAIRSLKLEDRVDFRSEYMDDETCLRLIAEADLFVNPYRATNESASAATRYGMAARVPVSVTPLRIFDDLGNAVFRMSGTAPEDLAAGIADALDHIIGDTPIARNIAQAADAWRRAHDYALIGTRIENIAHALSLQNLPKFERAKPTTNHSAVA